MNNNNMLSLYKTYYTYIYPFEQIYKFITRNNPERLSAQCRDMRIEFNRSDTMTSKKRFNRKNLLCFKNELFSLLPHSVHIGCIISLLIPRSLFHISQPQSNMRLLIRTGKRINEKNDEDINPIYTKQPKLEIENVYSPSYNNTVYDNERNFVSPLQETLGDYIHFIPIFKELVFDIDIPDFDRFCDCKENKMLCSVCWIHIEGAYFIMNFILTELFGYDKKNILYVFSGGKGLHCFINDKRALNLNEQQRFHICDKIQIGNGDDNDRKNGDDVLFSWIHTNSNEILSNKLESLFFNNVIRGRDLLKNISFRRWILSKLQKYYPSTYNSIHSCWSNDNAINNIKNKDNVSVILWKLLTTFEVYEYHNTNDIKSMIRPSLFIIYRLYYPMIDKQPLKLTHDIKLPFSIHSKTSNISLPIDQSFMESIDKSKQIININSLCHYYNTHKQKQQEETLLPKIFKKGVTLLEEWLNQY
jgi:DNA primase catalytic subunit